MQFDKTIDRHNHEVNAVIGATAPSLYQEKERIAAFLLANILGGPASNSLLNSLLREKNGWVYNVECSYTQYRDSGIMAISIGCDRANLDKCLAAIYKTIARLQDEPLSPARLRAAKKQVIGQMAISSDNGETQCLVIRQSPAKGFPEILQHLSRGSPASAGLFDAAGDRTRIYNHERIRYNQTRINYIRRLKYGNLA